MSCYYRSLWDTGGGRKGLWWLFVNFITHIFPLIPFRITLKYFYQQIVVISRDYCVGGYIIISYREYTPENPLGGGQVGCYGVEYIK